MELDDGDRVAPRRPEWTESRVGERIQPWIEWFGLARLVGSAAAIVLVVAGGWWLLRAPAPPTEARLPYAPGAGAGTSSSAPAIAATGSTTTSTVPGVVVVHVAGSVVAPGVFELPSGARVHDAVDAAGGLTAAADPAAVNLAAAVVDGERIYVTAIGESPPPPAPSGRSSDPPGSTEPAGPVDLNRATAEQLDGLPGVGPATAAAIVAHRDEHGPFATVDDLDDVSGIGPAKLEALRDLVTT